MILDHGQQGVGLATVCRGHNGVWDARAALEAAAKLAFSRFPNGFDPGVVEVRVIAQEKQP